MANSRDYVGNVQNRDFQTTTSRHATLTSSHATLTLGHATLGSDFCTLFDRVLRPPCVRKARALLKHAGCILELFRAAMALRRDVHSADTLMSGLGQLLRSASCDDLETLKKVAEESNRQVLFKGRFPVVVHVCPSISIESYNCTRAIGAFSPPSASQPRMSRPSPAQRVSSHRCSWPRRWRQCLGLACVLM